MLSVKRQFSQIFVYDGVNYMKRTELFGTDGIRCRAGVAPLDPRTVFAIGQSLVRLLGVGAKVVVGRDTRESGGWIEGALAAGIEDAGGRLLTLGVITTPGVAFVTRESGAHAGVVISASHNPYYDNGIKVFSPSGRKLSEEMEGQLAVLLSESESSGQGSSSDKLDQFDGHDLIRHKSLDESAGQGYIDDLTNRLASVLRTAHNLGRPLSGLRMVVDCANGAAAQVAPSVFAQFGASVSFINASPDGRNINEKCGALDTRMLRRQVIETRAEIGLAFDGDADRLILVDQSGAEHDGDSILFIIGTHLKRQKRLPGDRVVATVMSNFGLELALRDRGVNMVRTAVGDKYVLEELLQRGGAIGGEQSGHIIFPEISLAGDGIITAIELLGVMSETGQNIIELTRGLVRTPQVLINLPVERKVPLDSLPIVQEALQDLRAELASTGRALVRYSGTENIVRIMIEGTSESMIRERAEQLSDLLSSSLKHENFDD